MDSRAVKNREHRRLLLKGLGLSAVVHAAAFGMTFDVVDLEDDEPPRTSEVMSRPPFVATPLEVIRLSSRSTASMASKDQARVAARPSTPSHDGATRPSSHPAAAASAAPTPEATKPWDAPLEAGLANAILDQVAPLDASTAPPVVFGDLSLVSPEPPEEGVGESDSDDDRGGWLSGITGIFGDIGISLDGGICPVPRGRAGWR